MEIIQVILASFIASLERSPEKNAWCTQSDGVQTRFIDTLRKHTHVLGSDDLEMYMKFAESQNVMLTFGTSQALFGYFLDPQVVIRIWQICYEIISLQFIFGLFFPAAAPSHELDTPQVGNPRNSSEDFSFELQSNLIPYGIKLLCSSNTEILKFENAKIPKDGSYIWKRKMHYGSIMSVRSSVHPSVRMFGLPSHWTDLDQIWRVGFLGVGISIFNLLKYSFPSLFEPPLLPLKVPFRLLP